MHFGFGQVFLFCYTRPSSLHLELSDWLQTIFGGGMQLCLTTTIVGIQRLVG
jgi:hypothetical protein